MDTLSVVQTGYTSAMWAIVGITLIVLLILVGFGFVVTAVVEFIGRMTRNM